jgi:spore coat polysaccharide biosynthesis protein SpsF (cytidylyltransferase family)
LSAMNVVAIVRARVGSTRLPAKVLLDLGGATALQRCLDRVARFEGLSDVLWQRARGDDHACRR